MPSWFFRSIKSSPPTPALTQPTRRSPKHSLLHYETSSPPPSARVDPKLKLQPRRPLRLWDYWKFGAIVAAKATEVTSDVVSHHIWGPRRQSWGIEMTIVTSLIRGAERHSALVDIGTIRMLMSLGGLVPLPSDAIVTPVTFRVKKRNLPGILAEFDAQETGERELSGEWVIGRKTWQRRQSEWKAARKSDQTKDGATTPEFGTASPPSQQTKERVVLYIHGGAYYLSSAAAQRIISIPLAKYTDSRVFALDYRLAPETCFPGPLHDAVTAYLRLVEDLHIPPENVILCGDSAGGGLSLALLMYLRDNGYALPAGAILLSPWVDLTMSCESWETNAAYDVVPCPTADNHMNPIALYLGDRTEEYLTHPYASPLFGDFKGLPPLLIQAGDAEVLRDEIGLLAHKATLSGVEVRHELYDDAIHVFQAYPFLEASKKSFESMRYFVKNVLPQKQTRSPKLLAAAAERGLEREIETDRAIVVGGDGIENPAPAPIGQFSEKPFLSLSTNSGQATPSSFGDGDDSSSWIKSPAWSKHKLPSRVYMVSSDIRVIFALLVHYFFGCPTVINIEIQRAKADQVY
ncbi:Alpha/Beta hydrolase protein [Panaeolus papilionaceus]|nr:Alpha/Beta hydrolase protein [Panaeolus papilionaceus]